MADFSAADVAALRKATGAGMMDCKQALEENDGDIEAAKDWLRTKGKAGSEKRAGRSADQGAVDVLVEGGVGAIVELTAETDFVAKGADFIETAQKIADAAAEAKPADVEALKGVQVGDQTVAELVESLAVAIGEKIELGDYVHFDGPVVVYLHKRAADLPPAVGVLVEYDGDADAARGAAKQVAAMRPQYLTRDEVPADIVEHERQIAEATSREEGKPEQAIAKITEGRLNGFFKEVVLLEQPSVTENKKTVRAVLDESGTTVKRFARFEVGA